MGSMVMYSDAPGTHADEAAGSSFPLARASATRGRERGARGTQARGTMRCPTPRMFPVADLRAPRAGGMLEAHPCEVHLLAHAGGEPYARPLRSQSNVTPLRRCPSEAPPSCGSPTPPHPPRGGCAQAARRRKRPARLVRRPNRRPPSRRRPSQAASRARSTHSRR